MKNGRKKEIKTMFKWGFISIVIIELIIFFLMFSFSMRMKDGFYFTDVRVNIGITFAEGFFAMVCSIISFILAWLIRGWEKSINIQDLEEMSESEHEERILLHKKWIEKKKIIKEEQNKIIRKGIGK